MFRHVLKYIVYKTVFLKFESNNECSNFLNIKTMEIETKIMYRNSFFFFH